MLELRAAEPGDEEMLLAWRNDAGTREASLDTREISPAEHHQWFVQKLEDPDCAILVVEVEGRPLGQVRLDRVADDVAEISIGLAAYARGRGLGREAISRAALEAPRLLGTTTIRALVRRANEASPRASLAAGFRLTADDGRMLQLLYGPDVDSATS